MSAAPNEAPTPATEPASPELASVATPAPAKKHPVKVLVKHFRATCDLIHYEGKSYAVPRTRTVDDLMGAPGVAQLIGPELRRKAVRIAWLHPDIKEPLTKTTAETLLLHLDAEAAKGPETPVALRFHHDPEARRVCVDLGRPDGHAVVIDASGWEVGAPPAGVVFRRSHATKPLPSPIGGARLDELAPLLSLVPDSLEFRGLLGWLLGLPFVAAVRPGVLLVGPYGSGKSTRLRLLTSVVEPSSPGALGNGLGKNFGDDLVRATHRAVPLWDNLTAVSGAVSDELCCLVTGTARETRALYSDNDLNAVPVARPLGLTAVGVPAGLRPDALDRLITVEAPPLAQRVADDQLQGLFDALHPRLLGALCDAVAAALDRLDVVPATNEHRMAAHVRHLAAIDLAVEDGELPGCPAGLVEAYAELADRTKRRAVAEDTFGGALLALLDVSGGQWSGKASELLYAAGIHAPAIDRAVGWPTSARRVPEVLNHLREGLLSLGVTWSTTTVRGSTRYTFQMVGEASA